MPFLCVRTTRRRERVYMDDSSSLSLAGVVAAGGSARGLSGGDAGADEAEDVRALVPLLGVAAPDAGAGGCGCAGVTCTTTSCFCVCPGGWGCCGCGCGCW